MGEGQAATLLLGSWKIWAQTNQKQDKTERKNVLVCTGMSLVGLIPATANHTEGLWGVTHHSLWQTPISR